MDDELANFIRERKARVAVDKASLEQDLPYMEIRAKPQVTYVSTVKENIPPKTFAQAKEENYTVGLPLGVEYERKKQRLRHELRMDYRRYMAQKKHFESGESEPLIHLHNRSSMKADLRKQQAPLLRDVATLTEDSRWLHRDVRLTEAMALSPEEEEGLSALARRRRDRLERPLDQLSDEELELTEGRQEGYTKVGASYENRQLIKIDGREMRENPVGVARTGRRLKAQTKKEDAEFATGLIIGSDVTYEASQRRKECYRQELQEQIAEQHRNKKREKDLELKVAATGATDPEKQPDRIRQFGLGRRKHHQVSVPLALGEGESSARAVLHDGKMGAGETPPPEQPHVAFQSPLLDYNAALGLEGGGGLSPNSHPAVPTFPRSMDTPRVPLFPPHPPTLGEAFRSSYADPQHYYGTRNLFDPNMAYYGHMSFPAAGLAVPYWNVPPGGAVASQFDSHSQNSGGSFPEPQIQPNREASAMDSQVRFFPSERPRSTRDRILNYREALKQQIQEQQERRHLEREEKERYDAQLEADIRNHQPWGRGGGGAPLRDSTGNLIADLNQMHKLNEEAYSNPEQWQKKAKAAVVVCRAEQPDPRQRVSATGAEGSDRVSGFTHVRTPQFARGNAFANQPTQQQLQEQDKYKAYLRQQIEEKMRKKAEEREQTKLEEEKEEKRLAEQRARIQREYDEEQEKKKRKEIEQKAKNEELIQLAEQRRKEAEKKKKEEEERESAALRRQYEDERRARLEAQREPSPPIPTLQKKHGLHTPRPPTVVSQHSTAALSERSLSGLQSPPVPARRNQLRATGEQCDVFSELSALRRQLRSEQKRLEGRLQHGDWEILDSPLSDRHHDRPLVDVFDMARLRLQAPVRRPISRNLEPRNLLQLRYTDGESQLGFSNAAKLEEVRRSSQKRWDHREPYNQFSSQRSTVQDLHLSPAQLDNYLSDVTGGGSLLDSESAFIGPLGDSFPVAHTSDLEKLPELSARERRRLAKQSQLPQELGAFSQYTDHHEGPSTPTGDRLLLGAEPREEGRDRDKAGHRGNTTAPVDLFDDDASHSQFPTHNLNHHISSATVATDHWLLPGSPEIPACVDRPSRGQRLTT